MSLTSGLLFSESLRFSRFLCRRWCFSRTKNIMPRLYVRCVPGEEKLKISLDYAPNSGAKVRTYNLERYQSEELRKTFARLKCNILKATAKKRRKGAARDEEEGGGDLPISLWHEASRVSEDTVNREAWRSEAELVVGDSRYSTTVNGPKVVKLSMPACIMAAFPVFLKYELEFAAASDCRFNWYRGKPLEEKGSGSPDSVSGWEEVGRDRVYVPSNSDIDYKLKVACFPEESGDLGLEALSAAPVSAGPGKCPFEDRHLYTRLRAEHQWIISYNILADLYADSDFSRSQLYPYCPPYALEIDYRKQLLLKEITGYNGDLICLQEVDKKVFDSDFLPALTMLDYEGLLKLKSGQVAEGCATFYRKSKFRFIGQHDIVLSEALQTEPAYQDLYKAVCSDEVLREKITQRQTILQVTILESLDCPGKMVCIANTHLYFHPTAYHIRLLQIAICVRHLKQVIENYEVQGKGIALVFCGDFNSSPKQGVHVFMTTKIIPEHFEEWKIAESTVTGLELTHSFEMISACGYPEYTNYVGGFCAMLDYIYMDTSLLEVTKVVPMPAHQDIVLHCALPSVVFPSDHIAQVCDVRWK